jgi:S-adenosylmethionine synthetase
MSKDTINKPKSFIFTSESVSEGHPDKVCDQISDSILDAYLTKDPQAHVACETLVTEDQIVLSGEISSSASVNIEETVRETIRKIGYNVKNQGFDDGSKILNLLHSQEGALRDNADVEGAGDQGLMFGHACSQTKQLMPLPILLAHKVILKLAQLRKDGTLPYLMPDAKSQVSFLYENMNPVKLDNLVISTHHLELSASDFTVMKGEIIDLVVNPVIKSILNDCQVDFKWDEKAFQINPLGMWTEGGPAHDTGLTGRKIIVDTYGGWGRHGGGAFSGKDATKVDRSACYMARHIAKSIVASEIASECEVQFGFVIGESQPISLMIDTFGTGDIPEIEIIKHVRKNFDLSVKGIIDYLELRQPIFSQTAAYGHFGRDDIDLSWEKVVQIKV